MPKEPIKRPPLFVPGAFYPRRAWLADAMRIQDQIRRSACGDGCVPCAAMWGEITRV